MAKNKKIIDSAFLSEWLAEYEASKRDFETSLIGLSETQLEELAITNEFRTARLHRAFIDHHGLILRRFVEEQAFAHLWQALAAYDAEHETFAFTAFNGGVPATILRRLDAWYRLPKFTPIQLKTHYAKITSGCDELLRLLRQVTPSELGDRRFTAFNDLDPRQAQYMLRCFQSPEEVGRRRLSNGTDDSSHTRRFVTRVLEQSGITPIAALEWIKQAAIDPPDSSRLPTKLRAKGAKRTYFIHETYAAINEAHSTIFHKGSIASNQLLADLVSLIADTDCTADDVRKALKKNPEDC